MLERDAPEDEAMPAPIRERQLVARRLPGWLRIAIAVPFLGAGVACIVLGEGPYRWIADAEAAVLAGRYHPQLAGLITILVSLLPAAVIIQAIARRMPPTQAERTRPPRATALPKRD